MKKILIIFFAVFFVYILFVNLTSGYFEWNCSGEVSYRQGGRGCQLLPKPHSQNVWNNFLLKLNILDFNKQEFD